MKSSNHAFSLAVLFLLTLLASGGVYGLYRHGRETEADMVITGRTLPTDMTAALPDPLTSSAALLPSNERYQKDGTDGSKPAKRSRSSSKSTKARVTKLKHPSDGQININTASLTDLERLPGVGPAIATKILEYRKKIGAFVYVEQLKGVKGIGEKRMEKLKPFIAIH